MVRRETRPVIPDGYLLGLREKEVSVLTVCLMFPQELRQVGALYRVGPIQWGTFALHVEYRVMNVSGYRVRISCGGQQQDWEGTWGEARKISL
ncbi:MAG: hypothetical protein M3Y76_01585 [Chloroflexota bacterium]|nr:hypothetical protein [Chloroflexota bacterium]